MPDAPQHLALLIDDQGSIDEESQTRLAHWFRALSEAPSRSEFKRVLIATHGGLIDEGNGKTFADHIPEVLPGHRDIWSVTFITRTGFMDTVKQLIDKVFTDPVLTLGKQIVGFYRAAGPDHTFPQMNFDSVGGLEPARWVILRPTADGVMLPLNQDPEVWGHEAFTVGPPLPLPHPEETTVNRLVDQLTAELKKKLEEGGQPVLNGERLRVKVKKAAVEAARQLPSLPSHGMVLSDRLKGARKVHFSWSSLFPTLAYHTSVSGGGFGGTPSATLPDEGPNALDARIIEALAREIHLFPAMWRQMKSRVTSLFDSGNAGAEFLQRLSVIDGLRVTLLGHSLGGIFVDSALRYTAAKGYMGLVDSVFYLAAANTMAYHQETRRLIDWQLKHAPVKVFYLALTPEEELDEVGQNPSPYPRTILYLISNGLEREVGTPLLGMGVYARGHPLLSDYSVTWTPQLSAGLTHTSHGGFIFNPSVQDWIRKHLASLK